VLNRGAPLTIGALPVAWRVPGNVVDHANEGPLVGSNATPDS
jgi:hypothetical protein